MSKKCVYALGFFDGVHLGHGQLLTACRQLADELGVDAGVVTFSTHPDALVHGAAPGLINTLADRDALLRGQYQMDRVVTLPFDRSLMECPWEDFFHRLLEEFGGAGLVCGEDFRFGHKGLGSGEKLLSACRKAGIPCIVVPQLKLGGITVSSTHIRDLIQMGLVEHAIHFLGHPHILTGTVVPGHQLGRRLGFPTANILLSPELVVPKFGVYVCRCRVDGVSYATVTNVGTRPTVDGLGVTVESWILDYSGDLYGRDITLEFYKFLRPELKFPNLAALRQAVLQDGEKTKEILKGLTCNPENFVVK
jgi:riboflavin kinase/FMN adenylyltransferase